nr:uncharacterized protein LOC126543492 [Dermacentor andersoni]
MERIKNKRTAHRAPSTSTIPEVNEIIQSVQFDIPALCVLESRLKAAKLELSVLYAELETFMTDEQATADYDTVMEYEDAANSALALFKHNIDMLKVSFSPPTTQPPTASDGNQASASSKNRTRSQREFGARLPKLEHVRFDGTVARWQMFWDMFLHSIHENPRLSHTDLFHYVISLLDGAAEQAVAGIEVTKSSYSDAFGILKQRVNHKLIEQNLLENL